MSRPNNRDASYSGGRDRPEDHLSSSELYRMGVREAAVVERIERLRPDPSARLTEEGRALAEVRYMLMRKAHERIRQWDSRFNVARMLHENREHVGHHPDDRQYTAWKIAIANVNAVVKAMFAVRRELEGFRRELDAMNADVSAMEERKQGWDKRALRVCHPYLERVHGIYDLVAQMWTCECEWPSLLRDFETRMGVMLRAKYPGGDDTLPEIPGARGSPDRAAHLYAAVGAEYRDSRAEGDPEQLSILTAQWMSLLAAEDHMGHAERILRNLDMEIVASYRRVSATRQAVLRLIMRRALPN